MNDILTVCDEPKNMKIPSYFTMEKTPAWFISIITRLYIFIGTECKKLLVNIINRTEVFVCSIALEMFSIVSKQTDLKSNYIKELENTLLFARKVF